MYYVLIFFILILYYSLSNQSNEGERYSKERLYCLFICLALILLAAFRSDVFHGDTPGYRLDYEYVARCNSLGDIIDRWGLYYVGYFGLSKIFSAIGMPDWVWFGFVEFVYLFSLMKFMDKFSKDKIFSLLVFTTIGLFTFSLAGMKQTLAMAFMMFAYLCLVDKKYIHSVLLVVLTYFTHQAALIFLGAFALYYVRNWNLFIPSVLIVCALIFVYSYTFMETLVNIIGNEKWEDYLTVESGYSFVTFIFYISICTISLFGYRYYSEEDSGNAKFVLSMSLIAAALQLLARLSPSLFRLALLYSPFMMILLPNSCYYAPDNIRKPLKFVLMGCVIFYFLYTSRASAYSFVSL